MINACVLALVAITAASSASRQQNAERVIEIPASEAAAHLIKRAEPIYPAFALAAWVDGVVRLRATVATDGTVRTATVVSGPPLLTSAAIDAVKQWRYTPFTAEGRPAVASFEVEVAFVLPGRDGRDLDADRRASAAFHQQWEECRQLLVARKFQDAGVPCVPLPELAEKLPPDRQLERAHAHESVAMLHFGRLAYAEALTAFQRALAVRQSVSREDDADLAMAFHAVAWGHRMVGDAAEARRNYETAETTLRKSLRWVDALNEKIPASRELHEEFRQRYTGYLRTILTDFLSFLKQSGDTEAMAAAQLRLDALKQVR